MNKKDVDVNIEYLDEEPDFENDDWEFVGSFNKNTSGPEYYLYLMKVSLIAKVDIEPEIEKKILEEFSHIEGMDKQSVQYSLDHKSEDLSEESFQEVLKILEKYDVLLPEEDAEEE